MNAGEEQREEASLDLRAMKYYQPPIRMLGYFTEALWNNPKIKMKLQALRFEFAKTLEEAEAATTPKSDDLDMANEGAVADAEGAFSAMGGAVGGGGEAPQGGGLTFGPLGDSNNGLIGQLGGNAIGGAIGGAIRGATNLFSGLQALASGGGQKKKVPQHGVKVTWKKIVERMVKYVKAHNFDVEEGHINRIFDAMRSSLLRARSHEVRGLKRLHEFISTRPRRPPRANLK